MVRAGKLSPRRIEVVRLVACGLDNAQIAQCLGISQATVSMHLSYVYRELGLRLRVHLALYALKNGIACLEDIELPERNNVLTEQTLRKSLSARGAAQKDEE